MTKHQPATMTVAALLNWEAGSAASRQDADALPDLLRDNGINPDDMTATVECSWPDHVITPLPNGDMSVRPA